MKVTWNGYNKNITRWHVKDGYEIMNGCNMNEI